MEKRKLLFETSAYVPPEKTDHCIPIDVFVDAPYDRLEFTYHFEPLYVEPREFALELIRKARRKYVPEEYTGGYPSETDFLPLKNLLTLSFDDETGTFRGSAHRGEPDQFCFVEEGDATPGLYPGKINRGYWRVTLLGCSIVTDLHYTLKVEGVYKG